MFLSNSVDMRKNLYELPNSISTPIHFETLSFFFKNILERITVNIRFDPDNIWQDEALVNVNAINIRHLLIQCIKAAGKQIRGLKDTLLCSSVGVALLSEGYGNTGSCGGIQNQKGFWLKINCIQMKLPNFENSKDSQVKQLTTLASWTRTATSLRNKVIFFSNKMTRLQLQIAQFLKRIKYIGQ